MEHFKKMKQAEKDILLQNIKSLPDTIEESKADEDHTDPSGSQLYSIIEKSPNPNFVILDLDFIENYKIELKASDSNTEIDADTKETDA